MTTTSKAPPLFGEKEGRFMKNLLDQVHFYIFGIFTGLVLSGVIFLIVRKTGLLSWIYGHETLAGAMIAATAAGATVFYLHLQIRQQAQLEENRREARLCAEKAALGHSLSAIYNLSKNMFNQGLKMALGVDFQPTMHPLNNQQIETLKACIEFASEKSHLAEKTKLITLLSEIQILKSRFELTSQSYQVPPQQRLQKTADGYAANSKGTGEFPYDLLSMLKSAATCFLIANELFDWSRSERTDKVLYDLDRLMQLFKKPYENNPRELWPELLEKLETPDHSKI